MDDSRVSYKFFCKPVYHPALKLLTIVWLVFFSAAAFFLLPILIPLHFYLRKSGRNGFLFDQRLCLGVDSFRKRS